MSIAFFRKHMKTFLWPIALIIIVSFGVTFTMGQVIRSMFTSVARIYDVRVTQDEFEAVKNELSLLKSLQGGDSSEPSTDEIIEYYIELKEMDRLGLALPEKEIAESRRRHYAMMMLQRDIQREYGSEDAQRNYWRRFYNLPQSQQGMILNDVLKRNPYDETEYFNKLQRMYGDARPFLKGRELFQRKDKFYRLVTSSAKATTAELYKLYRDQFHTRKVAIARFSSRNFEDSVTASNEELEEFYNDHRNRYFTENPRIDVQYVLGRPVDFETSINEPTDEELLKFYEDRKDPDYRDYEAEFEAEKKRKELQEKQKAENERKLREAREKALEEKMRSEALEKKEPEKKEEGTGPDVPPAPPGDGNPEEETPDRKGENAPGPGNEPAEPQPEKSAPGETGGAFGIDAGAEPLYSILPAMQSPESEEPDPPGGASPEPVDPEPAPAPSEKTPPVKKDDPVPSGGPPPDDPAPAEGQPAGEGKPLNALPAAEAPKPALKVGAPQKAPPPPKIFRKFDEVKDDIRRKMIHERTRDALEKAFSEFYTAIQAESRRAVVEGRGITDLDFETIKRIADYCELTAVHTGLIDNEAAGMLPGIGSRPIITELFTKGRLGEFSDVVELDEGNRIVVRLVERRRKEILGFEKIKKTVRELYIVEKSAEAAEEAAGEFVKLAMDGSIEGAMLEKGVEVIFTDFLHRLGYGGKLEAVRGRDSGPVLNHAFSVQDVNDWTGALEREQEMPAEMESQRLSEYMREKLYYVIKCLEIKPPDPNEFAKEIPTFQEDHVHRSRRMRLYSLWKDDAQRRANYTPLGGSPDSKRTANEYDARSRLDKLVKAEESFHGQYGRYATVEELEDPTRFEGAYLDPNVAGERDGYIVQVKVSYTGYEATAEPVEPGLEGTGNRRYSADESGEIQSETIEEKTDDE